MSGFNANFRNLATGGLTSFDGSANQRGSGNVLGVPLVLNPFMVLACGTQTTWDLTHVIGFSFFRTPDLLQNTRYNARQGNFVIDNPGPVDITVTARGFTPFVTFTRNAETIIQATDGSGVITHTVTADETGPWTVEVTSIEPYATGDFDILISCTPSGVLTVSLAIDKSSIIIGEDFVLTATLNNHSVLPVSFFQLTPVATSMADLFSDASGVCTLHLGYNTPGAGSETGMFSGVPGPYNPAISGTFQATSLLGAVSNIVSLSVFDPQSFTCAALAAWANSKGDTMSGNFLGTWPNYADSGDAFVTMAGRPILFSIFTGLGANWVKSDANLGCPKGTYTKTRDSIYGDAPDTIVVS